MNVIYLIGIFLGVASGLIGLITFFSAQKNNNAEKKKFLLITVAVFLVSLVITAANYFQQKPSQEEQKTGLYIANGSESRKVYFHNAPDPVTKREAFINSKAEVLVRKTENGFGYVEFMNTQGKPSYGWLEMKHLIAKP